MAAPPKKISYQAKETSTCPVCRHEFNQEKLYSGGGRLIAGKLTLELRRLFEESRKFGKIYPLAYEMVTCPKCLFTSFPKDFGGLTSEEQNKLKEVTNKRIEAIQKIFGQIDFTANRNLVLGAATYLLAVDCYHFRGHETAPTPKKAICAMRAAWLFDDINEQVPDRPYDKVRDFYYMKAVGWYQHTLEIMQTGDEPIEAAGSILGPDIDKNWGFDGIMYLNGYLTMKFIDNLAQDGKTKARLLMHAKKYLSKLYGSGKGSKSKPHEIVDMAKDVYDEINKKVEELGFDPNDYEAIKA